jgi:formate dehydrogenase subunit gamma
VHWTQALSFLILLASGLLLSVRLFGRTFGHDELLRQIHLTTAFFFVFLPAIVALAGDFRSVRVDIQESETWTQADIEWLRRPSLSPRPNQSPPGRFNLGQKLNVIFTVYCTLAFAVTGVIIWQSRSMPFSLVAQAQAIHSWLAYIALAVFLGHFYLSAIHPSTRPSLSGMFSGNIDTAWAQRHHPAWIPGRPTPSLTVLAIVRSSALAILGILIALLISRLGLAGLGANTTDPVVALIYRLSALPGTLHLHVITSGSHVLDLAALIWMGLLTIGFIAVFKGQSLLPAPLVSAPVDPTHSPSDPTVTW